MISIQYIKGEFWEVLNNHFMLRDVNAINIKFRN